jgi:hypothetical protein
MPRITPTPFTLEDEDEPESQVRLRAFGSGAPTERSRPAERDYFARVPVLTLSEADILMLPLDHRAGFLLSFIDGEATLENILDVSSMSPEEVLSTLEKLRALGVIAFR